MEQQLDHLLQSHPALALLIERSLRVLVILAIVLTCAKLIHIICTRILSAARKTKIPGQSSHDVMDSEHEKRLSTVIRLIDTSLRVMLFGAAALMILREFGLDITPLLTGAGIAGVALGFGAQSLVKDVISGFFLLIEDQIRVGDVIKVNNGLAGTVERMELRVTAVRDGDGTLHVIPNGEIKSVSNMTYDFANAVVDVPVPYATDLKKIWDILSHLLKDFESDPPWKSELRGHPEFLGITKFENFYMNFQVVAKTKPHARWAVARELRRRIKAAFDAAGIAFLSKE